MHRFSSQWWRRGYLSNCRRYHRSFSLYRTTGSSPIIWRGAATRCCRFSCCGEPPGRPSGSRALSRSAGAARACSGAPTASSAPQSRQPQGRGAGGPTGLHQKPKAVIFDLGGVVMPSPFPIFCRFEERHGLPVGSILDVIKRTGDGGAFARMERGELTVERFCEPFATEYSACTEFKLTPGQVKELMEGLASTSIPAVPEVLEVIRGLREGGIKTALLTNNFRWEDGRTVMTSSELDMDVVVQSSLEGVKKPDRAIYRRVLERLGVRAEEAVFLDDIGTNLKPARDMGIHTIKVSDTVFDALKELETIVKNGVVSIPGTSEVSEKLKLPVDPLAKYLQEQHGLTQESPPLVRQFDHGQSNPTYFISYGGSHLVLRKKPPGKLLPSAHAIEREYRIMKATGGAGVPSPKLLSLCEDSSVVGTPFYLMEYTPGRVLKNPSLPGMESSERKMIYYEIARVLAAIHSVDIERAKLTDFGKQGDYVARQVSRWSKQYQNSKTREIPAMDRLMGWLPLHTPPSHSTTTTVVHGDYRLDNLIFAADRPSVLAVLDWELSTLGDPMSDLAYCCMAYHMEPHHPALKGLVGRDLEVLGIPSEGEFISRYCELAGKSPPLDWNFYMAFSFFRVAAILQGVYKRSLQDQASSDNAHAVGMMAEGFAEKGWKLAQEMIEGASKVTGTTTSSVPGSGRSYSTQSSTEEASPISLITRDIPNFPPRLKELRSQLVSFMEEEVLPEEETFALHQRSEGKWRPHPKLEDLKSKARQAGLWNLFLPVETDAQRRYGAGLSNLEYAHLCEVMGRSVYAPEVFNCSAPDTGNMEVLARYGTEEQKERWLAPLLDGKIRSCFAMTEPAVASSDATNIQSSIARDGDSYVLNGRKWWISGAMDPRCEICIFMGKTDPHAEKHKQQSMILVPMATPGVKVIRPLTVFGFDDAPEGHAEMEFTDTRVPVGNMLLGEGRGFEIAQGRLGPGRVHHCMRLIGMAERALELMTARVQERVAFGKTLAEQGTIRADIARSRMEIEQCRLLTLKTAHMMDTVGNKAARNEIAMIKVAVPQMAQRVVDRAIQAHGAMGLSSDRPLAHFFAWSRILRLADGPDEVHLTAIGKMELRRVTKQLTGQPS